MEFLFDSTNPPETVEFNGVTYKLMGARKYYLSQSTKNSERKGAKGLHVAIWEHYNAASVPPNHCIHHKDENPFNNNPNNLEAVLSSEHFSEHGKKNWKCDEFRKRGLKNLSNINDKAKEWHKSNEGREWHKKHANHFQKAWDFREERFCAHCQKLYIAKTNHSKYCSSKCNQLHLARKKGVPLKNEHRNCAVCGNEFFSKTANQKYCNKRCRYLSTLKAYGKNKTA